MRPLGYGDIFTGAYPRARKSRTIPCLVSLRLLVRLPTTTRPAPIALLAPSSDDHGDGVAIRAPPALTRGAGLGGRGPAGVHHGAAARRAGAAGQQPGVHAGDVEPVPAPREHAHLLAVRELAQADGAHILLPWSTGDLASLQAAAAAAVHLHGDASQRAPLDPADAGRAARRRWRPLAAASAASGVPGRAPAPAPERAPRQRVETDGEQQREEERRQDDHHVGVEARVARPRRRRCRSRPAPPRPLRARSPPSPDGPWHQPLTLSPEHARTRAITARGHECSSPPGRGGKQAGE
ncbi:hypothetical protein PVAP13_3KG136281 [Panicum virgatum]|uniref:Uncharacterized protein n=1 Tax=Panicum virgatum TaxID=38727 RepID=A0A8T0UXD8_PANVG|nr:hypothetical protein PVAP13_3KG136281 [Panicum virgatum]